MGYKVLKESALKACVLSIAMVGVLAGPANAELSASELIKDYDAATPSSRLYIEGHVAALESGLGWANAEIVRGRHETPLYCSPKNVALVGAQVIGIVRDYLQTRPEEGRFPYGLIVLSALQDAFPCRAGK